MSINYNKHGPYRMPDQTVCRIRGAPGLPDCESTPDYSGWHILHRYNYLLLFSKRLCQCKSPPVIISRLQRHALESEQSDFDRMKGCKLPPVYSGWLYLHTSTSKPPGSDNEYVGSGTSTGLVWKPIGTYTLQHTSCEGILYRCFSFSSRAILDRRTSVSKPPGSDSVIVFKPPPDGSGRLYTCTSMLLCTDSLCSYIYKPPPLGLGCYGLNSNTVKSVFAAIKRIIQPGVGIVIGSSVMSHTGAPQYNTHTTYDSITRGSPPLPDILIGRELPESEQKLNLTGWENYAL